MTNLYLKDRIIKKQRLLLNRKNNGRLMKGPFCKEKCFSRD